MLEKLSEALKKATDKIAKAVFLDRKIIEEVIKELQRGLISADVNIYLVKEITDPLKAQALDEKVKGIEKKEQIIKMLYDTILEILGKEKKELKINEEKGKKQTIILLLGLYGAGKTTTAGKLGLYYSKRGHKVALLGLDVHRPAATDQLEQIAKQNKLAVFVNKEEKDPIKIYKKFKSELEDYDLLIVDTAGRHSLDKDLVTEIKDINKTIKPDYKILVIQADIGQAAKNQASEFQKALEINGVIITRMDSTAKAGGALTACHETHAPVYFIGTGEKSNELETFNPQAFISRILGMGDLEGLLEKVQSAIDKDSQKKLKGKLEKGEFDLRDFQEQLKSMSSMGSISKMMDMIPGLSGINKEKLPENMLGVQEEKMKKWQHAINSMTQEEIKNPEIIEKQTTRLGRIAKGSGTSTSDIRQLIKQYKLLKDFTKGGVSEADMGAGGFSQKQMMKLAKKFGKKMRM
ncbi:signal recognition particle protein [Candidatus Pacearchaeota archaeon]|nr:signal recognition particle protein [Candidatus Pacearchaeota archaeon]